jgi:predicted  nucleic acid-binding Zn-ribbon protein
MFSNINKNTRCAKLFIEEVDEMDGTCSTCGRDAFKILVGESQSKRDRLYPMFRWEENVRMDLREIGWDGVDWINLAQDRDEWPAVVNTVMNLRVP